MNGISFYKLDLNAAKYQSATAKKQVPPVEELKNSTETEKKKEFKTQLITEFDSHKESKNPVIILSENDIKNYRANLLNDIVNKMSGLEDNSSPGQYIEYFV